MSNRDWIAEQFSKGIAAEHHMALNAKSRVDDPPLPDLAVLYGQIAEADERHVEAVEAIAVRYGHTPSRGGPGGGIGETLGRLKAKVSEIGQAPMDDVAHDLGAKADAIHWMVAWVGAFEAVGDPESARELAAILAEERSHHEKLQEALARLVTAGAGASEAASDTAAAEATGSKKS